MTKKPEDEQQTNGKTVTPRRKGTDTSTDAPASMAPRFSTRVMKYHSDLGPRGTLLTLDETAAAARIARSTLNKLISDGRGPAVVYLTPSVPLVRQCDFEAWLESLVTPAATPDDEPPASVPDATPSGATARTTRPRPRGRRGCAINTS